MRHVCNISIKPNYTIVVLNIVEARLRHLQAIESYKNSLAVKVLLDVPTIMLEGAIVELENPAFLYIFMGLFKYLYR